VVFFKLRSVLGRRTGDEEARLDRYRSQRTAQPKEAVPGNDKIVTLPRREREDAKVETMVRESEADRNLRMTKFAGGDATIANGLIDIAKVDATFDPVEFMKGARAAYEMIVMAFAEGNKKLLADLLGTEVFSGFAAAIADRETRKQTIEQSFVGISSADVVEAENKAGIAQVTVKFVSELITATRSAAGEVVSGDPKRIKEVTDIWTFARDSASSNPNWKLVATQAAN
jgi:predicted lipid-binding transport protein (Tim44 family)